MQLLLLVLVAAAIVPTACGVNATHPHIYATADGLQFQDGTSPNPTSLAELRNASARVAQVETQQQAQLQEMQQLRAELRQHSDSLRQLNASIHVLQEQVAFQSTAPWTQVAQYPAGPTLCETGGVWSYVPGKGCHKASTAAGCATRTFPAPHPYQQVFGRLTAFQQGCTDGFDRVYSNLSTIPDSVSFWAGDQLLWSYVISHRNTLLHSCPSNGPDPISCPAQGGLPAPPEYEGRFYCATGAPGCSPGACSNFFATRLFGDEPPFFIQLPALTTADLQVRICPNEIASDEDIFVESFLLVVR
eukprot:m.168100 g.168100  ORF g.168100 m.168100 type:complete len:303 (+) comp21149_c0_seq2:91-999(+)